MSGKECATPEPEAKRFAVVELLLRANNLLPVPLKVNHSGHVVVWRGALFAEQKSLTPIYPVGGLPSEQSGEGIIRGGALVHIYHILFPKINLFE